MAKRLWTHKKYKGKKFIGKMVDAKGDRVLQLTTEGLKPKTYDTWQAAKQSGWVCS